MPFYLIEGDITKVKADAIVNAANTQLMPGSGVCGAIFKAAGFRRMSAACQAIGHCDAGNAVITPGFDLLAQYVIHTPGPIWVDGAHHEEAILRSCYRSCLQLAADNGCHSIAFPLISSGIFGYPYAEALRVARETIIETIQCQQDELNVYMVLLERPQHYDFLEKEGLARQLALMERREQESYLEHQRGRDYDFEAPRRPEIYDKAEKNCLRYAESDAEPDWYDDAKSDAKPDWYDDAKSDAKPDWYDDANLGNVTLEDMLENQALTFSEMLLNLIESRAAKPSDIYKKANIDRKLFYKIKQDKNYHPSKMTVLAFSATLELNIDEAVSLLNAAGFAFSRSSRADIIVRYYFERNIYDIFTINDALFYYGEPLLGNAIA